MFAGFSAVCLWPPSCTPPTTHPPSASLFPVKCFCLYTLSHSHQLLSNPCLYTCSFFWLAAWKYAGKKKENLRRGADSAVRWHRNSTYFLDISLYFFLHLHSSALWCENRKELCLNSTTLVPCGSDPISAISQSLLWLTGQRKLYFSPLAKCKPSANKSPYIFLCSLDIAFAICTYLITTIWSWNVIM